MGDLFAFAEQRLPDLYRDVRNGEVRDLDDVPTTDVIVVVRSKGKPIRLTGDVALPADNTLHKPGVFRHPLLFNYSKSADDVILDLTVVAEAGGPAPRRFAFAPSQHFRSLRQTGYPFSRWWRINTFLGRE